ncbi:neuraminidase-like domain-containing protein, partial [Pseudomonas helleri]
MNETLLAGLNESRRDALVAYYIQRVIPDRGLGELAEKIVSADDLYEYLLLDTQVSGLIKT